MAQGPETRHVDVDAISMTLARLRFCQPTVASSGWQKTAEGMFV